MGRISYSKELFFWFQTPKGIPPPLYYLHDKIAPDKDESSAPVAEEFFIKRQETPEVIPLYSGPKPFSPLREIKILVKTIKLILLLIENS